MTSFPWSEILLALALFVCTSTLGAVVTGAILVRLPADYFSELRPPPVRSSAHPALVALGRILRNLGGVLVILLGVTLAMPAVPGPGILLILLGISCTDFPGKRRLERWIIQRPRVLEGVNRLRRRYRRAPFEL